MPLGQQTHIKSLSSGAVLETFSTDFFDILRAWMEISWQSQQGYRM